MKVCRTERHKAPNRHARLFVPTYHDGLYLPSGPFDPLEALDYQRSRYQKIKDEIVARYRQGGPGRRFLRFGSFEPIEEEVAKVRQQLVDEWARVVGLVSVSDPASAPDWVAEFANGWFEPPPKAHGILPPSAEVHQDKFAQSIFCLTFDSTRWCFLPEPNRGERKGRYIARALRVVEKQLNQYWTRQKEQSVAGIAEKRYWSVAEDNVAYRCLALRVCGLSWLEIAQRVRSETPNSALQASKRLAGRLGLRWPIKHG
jgi:hypothetical protein